MLYGDLGLTPGSEDTRYFGSESDKNTWFNSLTPIVILQNNTYSRKDKGVLRISTPIANIYNAQYMRFRNINFENKWFYAFITKVEYVNNGATDIYFENDVMMTWMGIFTLGECYIEREHVDDDTIGRHTIDEGLDTGEYICEQTIDTSYCNEYKIGVWRSYDPQYDSQGLDPLKQGTYVPMITNFFTMDSTGVDALTQLINTLTSQNRIDSIIAMKLVPTVFTGVNADSDTGPVKYSKDVPKPYEYFINNTNIPKNKKLFTYPYKYLALENSEGLSVTYKYEYFNTYPPNTNVSQDCNFRFRGSPVTPEVAIMGIPHNYMNETWNYANACEMRNFPNVPWNVDTYKAYLAQRDSTLFGDIASSALVGAARGAILGGGNPGAELTGFALGTLNGMQSTGFLRDILNGLTGNTQYIMPNETKGKANTDLMAQSRTKNFYFRKMCITPEKMKVIDGFFTMYGYKVNETKRPSMNNRTRFTYVKTKGCNVHGNLPSADARVIENMFDSGIRFWKSTATIGDYETANPINQS